MDTQKNAEPSNSLLIAPQIASVDPAVVEEVEFFPGDAVECRYKGRNEYFDATICTRWSDSTYNILYDGIDGAGDFETHVKKSLIRKRQGATSRRRLILGSGFKNKSQTFMAPRGTKALHKLESQISFKDKESKQYKGVLKREDGWTATISVKGRSKVIGPFATALEAAKAHDTTFRNFCKDVLVYGPKINFLTQEERKRLGNESLEGKETRETISQGPTPSQPE
mmetsp:Transcript_155/g.198  ORF Transcript_155/g.198 Transcript_155/m.198 type:complete len:225 (+) Transcript_155:116-790(+)